MARRDALIRLHKSLLARRSDLRNKLADELSNMRNFRAGDNTGDSADVAFETGSDEMSSQLAAIDARELNQIERALARLKQGTYGLCEGCQTKIPVARLNALPYSTCCVECQREMERFPDWDDRRSANWDFDAGVAIEDQREVKLSEIEMDLTSNH